MKNLICTIILLLFVFSLSGCGKKESANMPKAEGIFASLIDLQNEALPDLAGFQNDLEKAQKDIDLKGAMKADENMKNLKKEYSTKLDAAAKSIKSIPFQQTGKQDVFIIKEVKITGAEWQERWKHPWVKIAIQIENKKGKPLTVMMIYLWIRLEKIISLLPKLFY